MGVENEERGRKAGRMGRVLLREMKRVEKMFREVL